MKAASFPKSLRHLLGFGVCVALCAVFVIQLRLTYNASQSMPVGFYRTEPLTRTIAKGQIVEYCPPEAIARLGLVREYIPAGRCGTGSAYLLKIVAGVRGDRVRLATDGVWINGRRLPGSRTLVRDSQRRPMPRVARGEFTLEPGELWLWTPNPRSWDSRYYGAVRSADVAGTAKLLLAV